MSALSTGRLYPQKIFLVLISVSDCVDIGTIVWPEGNQTRDLPTRTSVLQPTAPPRAARSLDYNCRTYRRSVMPKANFGGNNLQKLVVSEVGKKKPGGILAASISDIHVPLFSTLHSSRLLHTHLAGYTRVI